MFLFSSLPFPFPSIGGRMKIEKGDLVAFNTLPDAVWFEVTVIKGHLMTIREAGTDYTKQTMDTPMVRHIMDVSLVRQHKKPEKY